LRRRPWSDRPERRGLSPEPVLGRCSAKGKNVLTFLMTAYHLDSMLTFNPQLFVRIQEVEGPRAPVPRPLENGFSPDRLYRVLGIYTPSETAEAYFILPNDRDEIWFISQRHVRFGCLQEGPAQHLPLDWGEVVKETGEPSVSG
jgi:hypothetical protein